MQAMLPGRSSTIVQVDGSSPFHPEIAVPQAPPAVGVGRVPDLPLLVFLRQKIGHDRRVLALAVALRHGLAVRSAIRPSATSPAMAMRRIQRSRRSRRMPAR
jgi:hypothetical protein